MDVATARCARSRSVSAFRSRYARRATDAGSTNTNVAQNMTKSVRGNEPARPAARDGIGAGRVAAAAGAAHDEPTMPAKQPQHQAKDVAPEQRIDLRIRVSQHDVKRGPLRMANPRLECEASLVACMLLRGGGCSASIARSAVAPARPIEELTPEEEALLVEAATARLQQNQAAIDAAVERLSQATTGAEKKAASAERARLEFKSPAELAAETRAAIIAAQANPTTTSKYTDPEAIFAALEGPETEMVRGTWLRDAPPGTVLGKRGELPPEAIIGVQELRKIYAKAKPKYGSLPFIALSHYWRTKSHPDPQGETLALVSKALKSQWKHYEENGVTDVGVFIDWPSLFQEPRTEEQLVIFRESLGAINLWYAHKLTTVYIVSGGEVDGLTYDDKGWTSFEYLLANLIKVANTSARKDWPMLLDLGQDDPVQGKARPPPAEPLAFYAGHSHGAKVYTNGADRDKIVAPKFRKTMEEVLGSVEELNYNKLGWGDAQIVELSVVLPLCARLTKLQLMYNAIGDNGCIALAKPIASGSLAQLKVSSLPTALLPCPESWHVHSSDL